MPKIKELWAWVAIESGSDDEGISAMKLGESWFPMVGADRERMESLRGYVESLVEATGVPIKLVRFTTRKEMEVIEP